MYTKINTKYLKKEIKQCKKKIYQTFHGNINGIDIYNSNVYFALESILKSIEKSDPDNICKILNVEFGI